MVSDSNETLYGKLSEEQLSKYGEGVDRQRSKLDAGTEEIDPGIFIINRDDLVSEWELQAMRSYKFAQKAAQYRLKESDLKRQLEVAETKLGNNVRLNFQSHGITKLTEKAVEEVVQLDPSIEELNERIRNVRYFYDIYNAAVVALEQKRNGLDNLTRLQNSNYYASKQ